MEALGASNGLPGGCSLSLEDEKGFLRDIVKVTTRWREQAAMAADPRRLVYGYGHTVARLFLRPCLLGALAW